MWTQHERREFPRYPIRVPIRFRAAGEEEVRAQVGDLSDGGLCFSSPRSLAQGSEVEVVLPLEDQRFVLTGSVARCEPENHEAFRVGLSFPAPEEAFRRKLAEQVLRIHELRRELSLQQDEEVTIEEAARQWVEHYAKEFAELYG